MLPYQQPCCSLPLGDSAPQATSPVSAFSQSIRSSGAALGVDGVPGVPGVLGVSHGGNGAGVSNAYLATMANQSVIGQSTILPRPAPPGPLFQLQPTLEMAALAQQQCMSQQLLLGNLAQIAQQSALLPTTIPVPTNATGKASFHPWLLSLHFSLFTVAFCHCFSS